MALAVVMDGACIHQPRKRVSRLAGKPGPEATAMARSGVRPPWRAALGFVGWLGLVLLLLLEPAAPAAAAIVPVSSGNAAGPNVGAASPWNLQVNLNVPGNTTVVVAVAVKNTAVIPSSVTDSGGSFYFKVADQLVNVNAARVQLWATVAAGAKNSTWVKVNTCCTGTDMVAAVASYSGVVSLGTVVKAFSASASTTATVSVTTSDANNWVVAAMASAGGASLAASTGNLRQSAVVSGSIGGALMDNTSASPAAVSNTLTTGSAQYTAMAAVELRTVPGVYNIGSASGANARPCNAGSAPAPAIGPPGKGNGRAAAVRTEPRAQGRNMGTIHRP